MCHFSFEISASTSPRMECDKSRNIIQKKYIKALKTTLENSFEFCILQMQHPALKF